MTTDTSTVLGPPYISFRTILNLLDRLAEGGIPQRIDRGYWAEFLSGSAGAQLMVSLRSLELVDGSTSEPLPRLEQLVNRDSRKQAMHELVTERYSAVLAEVDLSRATAAHLEEVFRKQYRLDGATRRKAITFLLNAAQYAEMQVSGYITGKMRAHGASTKNSSATVVSRRKPTDTSGVESALPQRRQKPPSPPAGSTGTTRTIKLHSGAGTITLSYTVDLFDLDQHDQEFVLDLVRRLREYERQSANGWHQAGNSDELPSGDASRSEELTEGGRP